MHSHGPPDSLGAHSESSFATSQFPTCSTSVSCSRISLDLCKHEAKTTCPNWPPDPLESHTCLLHAPSPWPLAAVFQGLLSRRFYRKPLLLLWMVEGHSIGINKTWEQKRKFLVKRASLDSVREPIPPTSSGLERGKQLPNGKHLCLEPTLQFTPAELSSPRLQETCCCLGLFQHSSHQVARRIALPEEKVHSPPWPTSRHLVWQLGWRLVVLEQLYREEWGALVLV